MTENQISRVEILIQHKKYPEAERILKDLLRTEPGNVYYLTLLAEVNLQQGNLKVANEIINNAIGIAPDSSYLFYVKARVALEEKNSKEAEQSLMQAVALDPYDADYFALWAYVKLAQKQYTNALELADKALEIDAENLLGLNTRSTALLKLDNKEEAFITIEGALREDPNNAFTHANYGWSLLEKGDHKKALVHFKESLKNDPTLAYAQAGMTEALKANNVIYRLFLKYAFWIGNLTAKYQWAVIIGFYFGSSFLRSLARRNEALQPYLFPVVILLALVAFSTWVITPISNLFLRFNAYGKYLLNQNEKRSSNFVGISAFLFLVGLVLFFVTQDQKYVTVAGFGFAMMVLYGTMFAPSKYNSLLIYAIAMTLIGAGAIAITFSAGELFNALTNLFIFGFIAYQWVANYFVIKEDNS